jgi:DNA-directed RNA polymerase subunit L
VNGKPIELLSEIECEVQLKLAIENEDYTLADKLRKRLEKFR